MSPANHQRFEVGDLVDAKDSTGRWYEAVVIQLTAEDVARIHFRGWQEKWDENISLRTGRIQPLRSHTVDWREFIVSGDKVEVWDDLKKRWCRGVVTKLKSTERIEVELSGQCKVNLPFSVDLVRLQWTRRQCDECLLISGSVYNYS
jgi:hypothetical protein